MKRHAPPGLPWGCPYPAVGIQRALESAIGLPSRSTSASWMLAFLMPAEVSRYFTMTLLRVLCGFRTYAGGSPASTRHRPELILTRVLVYNIEHRYRTY